MLGTILAALLTVFPNNDADEGFADYLYGKGEYGMASQEYLRIIYSHDEDTLACPLASLRLARCWQELGRREDAYFLYTFLYRNLSDTELRAGAMMGAGSLLEESGNFDSARELYTDAAVTSEDTETIARAGIMAGLMNARMGNWEASAEELRMISSTGGPFSDVSFSLAAKVAEGQSLPHRSPLWCGISSAFLPGSGQMICGHYTDGIIAFGVNGALAWLFYESLQEDNTTTSVLLGWLGLSFYGGNIYGGSRAAATYNSARRRELLDEVTGILEDQLPFQ
ncbi:MAG: tetratricopeptide repeat protein [Candidatus Aegiribacteria sp.]|nr:tetratricopeptide repeat protein [Candidatus Aegiribacteria sp.]